ncbi:MAG: response regulator [Nitrospinae bacterium]|nr:response regulator [Nitrospinota bacterium]MZH41546.1 response regulator [Nitrospinota bacterium]
MEVVDDGAKALDRLRQSQFDVLLTDWMMPEMDGATLIQKVRKELDATPLILMVTAVGDDESRRQVLKAKKIIESQETGINLSILFLPSNPLEKAFLQPSKIKLCSKVSRQKFQVCLILFGAPETPVSFL